MKRTSLGRMAVAAGAACFAVMASGPVGAATQKLASLSEAPPVQNPDAAIAATPNAAVATAPATVPGDTAVGAPPPPLGAIHYYAPSFPADKIQSPDLTNPALAKLPSDAAALGGYDVLIADRGNNRLLLISPQKKTLWEYRFRGLSQDSGADDAFFADRGKSVITNLEHQQVIEMIDVATKKVTWSYGKLGHAGSAPGYLNFPDDAYQLPNGDITVADIRNCRILEINRAKQIVRQAGITRHCWGKLPSLQSPNGDKPLPNGHLLVSTIRDHSIVEYDKNWKPLSKLVLPIRYPSDPQLTQSGNYLVASYTKNGSVIEITPAGKVVWSFEGKNEGGINKSSLAIELPNGNILATDDLNQRVIVIGKRSKKILWQYGVTGHPGSVPGYLRIPDGLDIIREAKK